MSDSMPLRSEASIDANRLNEILTNIAQALHTGEQLPLLANLNLANQILNENLQQQLALLQDQTMNDVVMAVMAKCVTIIARNGSDSGHASEAVAALSELYSHLQSVQAPIAATPAVS